MTKLNPESIEKYQETLRRDPHSLAFAPLAEAFRERGQLQQGLQMAQDGVRRHPQYAGGWLVLGRLHYDLKSYPLAETALRKAVELDGENLLALCLLGDCYLHLEKPKEALKSYKRALFINPNGERASVAIQKLESLSADEFPTDAFPPEATAGAQGQETITSLERSLSLLDALIVRGELGKAEALLEKLELFYTGHVEVTKRREVLTQSLTPEPDELTEDIVPLPSPQDEMIQERLNKKKKWLEAILKRVAHRAAGLEL